MRRRSSERPSHRLPTRRRETASSRINDTTRDLDEVPRLGGENVAFVGGPEGAARAVERDEAGAAFHDQRVLARGDDVTEAHAPDGVGGEPGLHAHFRAY